MTNQLIKNTKKLAASLFLLVLTAVIATTISSAQVKVIEVDRSDSESTKISPLSNYDLVGSWNVVVTPDDGSPSFKGFYSFGIDGNASFSSAGPPVPALGNPG